MIHRAFFLLPLLIIIGACRRDEITSIWVPKDVPAAVSTQHTIQWKKPPSWTERTASDMRVASFVFKGKDDSGADISVVRLAGDGGGLAANINRWRGQLQLEPTTPAAIEKSLDQLNVDGHPMFVTSLKNKGAGMLAAIYTLENESWYFKMTGTESTLQQARASFYEFIKSVRHPH